MPKNTKLRLAQFNVENLFVYMDLYSNQDLDKMNEAEWQKSSASTTHNKPIKKLRELAKAINDIQPDILLLNEVGGVESLENFNRFFLNNYYQVFLKEGNSNRGIDVGYLINPKINSKPILITHKDRPINFLYPHQAQTAAGGKSHYFSRDVAELRLFHPDENSPYLVILLTHLKSKLDPDGIDPEGRLRRAAELKTLVSIYKDIKNELGESIPMVMGGDLNGNASRNNTEPEFPSLYEVTDLEDALEICQKPTIERYTQVQINPLGQQQFLQIDYLFVSKNLQSKIIHDETYVYHFKNELGQPSPAPKNIEERNLLPSDHYPLILTLGF